MPSFVLFYIHASIFYKKNGIFFRKPFPEIHTLISLPLSLSLSRSLAVSALCCRTSYGPLNTHTTSVSSLSLSLSLSRARSLSFSPRFLPFRILKGTTGGRLRRWCCCLCFSSLPFRISRQHTSAYVSIYFSSLPSRISPRRCSSRRC
jgi:hypothetical protein